MKMPRFNITEDDCLRQGFEAGSLGRTQFDDLEKALFHEVVAPGSEEYRKAHPEAWLYAYILGFFTGHDVPEGCRSIIPKAVRAYGSKMKALGLLFDAVPEA